MKFNTAIIDITTAGLMSGLGLLIGIFGNFPLGGDRVYLLPAITFLFPICLSLFYLNISMTITVILTDLSTGWLGYTWISVIAYNGGMIIIFFMCKLFKNSLWSFLPATVLAAGFIAITYFFLEWVVFGLSFAIQDLIATCVQMTISLPIVWVLFKPIKKIVSTYRG